jgi:hypothetical protein
MATNTKNQEPDATENKGCFTCENVSCSCGNNEAYIKKLVACITEEVMSKLGN